MKTVFLITNLFDAIVCYVVCVSETKGTTSTLIQEAKQFGNYNDAEKYLQENAGLLPTGFYQIQKVWVYELSV
jgi:hypothetical protein